MSGFSRRHLLFAVVVLVVGCVAVALAQSKTEMTDGSLAAISSELRQLRLAVEELGRNQTQAQALSVFLSAQQGRIQQSASRLDAAREEVEVASIRSQEVAFKTGELEKRLQENPEFRPQLESNLRDLKAQQALLSRREDQARARESELSQALAGEESRWADLVSRLERQMKK